MSAPEPLTQTARDRGVQRYGTLVVCGGGCYGSYYVRQLRRAAAAGALVWERLLVIDQDAACRVAREGGAAEDGGAWLAESRLADGASRARAGGPPRLHDAADETVEPHHSPALRVVVSPWTAFFDAYLAHASANPEATRLDAIVPSPLMPHLTFEWLMRRAVARWPLRAVRAESLPSAPGMPWHRHAEGATYVSFAEWMCPINCVEPARCPETRGPRSWSVPPAVAAYVAAEQSAGTRVAGPALMHCVHRAYGVGMFDTAEVLAADAVVSEAAAAGEARVVVGTVSHCHGALGVLHVGG